MIRQAMDWVDHAGGWADVAMVAGLLLTVVVLLRMRRPHE